ncbi:MAG: siphovirus Gp157 family protein [Roseibium sp.]|nr:siphovirus Gp157 family protein [Roseibium sp.]
MSNAAHELYKESRKAATFVDGIKHLLGEDDDLLHDMLEGETDLMTALQKAADAIDEENVLIDGMDKRIGEMQERKRLAKARVQHIKTLIEQALVMAGDMKTVRLPNMTITLRDRKPAPVIERESDIPSRFWIPQPPPDPKLDKKALAEAMNGGAEVPGCHLDNGGVTLAFRRK